MKKEEILNRLERWVKNIGYNTSEGDIYEIINDLRKNTDQETEELKAKLVVTEVTIEFLKSQLSKAEECSKSVSRDLRANIERQNEQIAWLKSELSKVENENKILNISVSGIDKERESLWDENEKLEQKLSKLEADKLKLLNGLIKITNKLSYADLSSKFYDILALGKELINKHK